MWKRPQIENLRLVIPKHYTLMTSNRFFIALGITDSTPIKSTIASGTYKTSSDTLLPPKLLSLHCKQINKVKNEAEGEPSRLLACMQVSGYKAAFTLMYLMLLEQDTHHCYLNFKALDENNNAFISSKFSAISAISAKSALIK